MRPGSAKLKIGCIDMGSNRWRQSRKGVERTKPKSIAEYLIHDFEDLKLLSKKSLNTLS